MPHRLLRTVAVLYIMVVVNISVLSEEVLCNPNVDSAHNAGSLDNARDLESSEPTGKGTGSVEFGFLILLPAMLLTGLIWSRNNRSLEPSLGVSPPGVLLGHPRPTVFRNIRAAVKG